MNQPHQITILLKVKLLCKTICRLTQYIPGESLEVFSKRTGIPLDQIVKLNSMSVMEAVNLFTCFGASSSQQVTLSSVALLPSLFTPHAPLYVMLLW
jgi:hypothetical protein